jgi:hypothetical protein
MARDNLLTSFSPLKEYKITWQCISARNKLLYNDEMFSASHIYNSFASPTGASSFQL